ncbi:MAG: ABC transporter permease subunit [Spirochaetales bacterium]|jgi:ABC-2 type transport system permease protein|nr:ABC transporter permease subunit [Spirochaetales bacterium]
MAVKTLFLDEFKGFARSKVMTVLWIGLPLLSMFIRFIQPDADGLPLLTFIGILLASIGGTVAAVVLSTGITSERNRHVYDLFLVRPIKRRDLILAKFLAAFVCLLIAVVLSVFLGVIIELIGGTKINQLLFKSDLESMLVALTGIAIACSVGIFFGIVMNTVAVSAILSAYLGNQITGLIILPLALVSSLNIVVYCALVGTLVPAGFLLLSITIFAKKTL